MIGEKFGRLTVIENVPKRKRKTWLCRCECGNFTQSTTSNLRGGGATSCGCYRRERTTEKNGVDLTGSKVNMLTVLKLGSHTSDGARRWVCRCDCGKIIECRSSLLLQKKVMSCGCYRSIVCKSPETIRKRKKTCLERYGAEMLCNTDEVMARHASKKEIELRRAVEEIIGRPLKRKRIKVRGKSLEIDMFDEELKIGIEYNGVFFHSEKRCSKNYHLDKTLAANQLGWQLIHLFDVEFNNKNKKKRVLSFLRSKFQKNKRVIGARKVVFAPIAWSHAAMFCEQWHMQGQPHHALLSLGAILDDEIVAVATFGRHHRDSSKVVLSRFACKENVTISGCLGKFSKLASHYFKTEIITWVDRRFSEGGSYKRAGWVIDGILKPDYFYTKGYNLISKQSRQKKKIGTPEGMTENEHAQQDKLLKVWDCGKIRFVYPYKT